MRTEFNPNSPHAKQNKGQPPILVAKPAKDIGLCVVTHLPNREGYHKDRFEVIQACLHSMAHGAGKVGFDLYIWDNGSDRYFLEWLVETFPAEVMIFSTNIGGWNARMHLANIARNKILSFTDDDVFFYPDWLEKELEILEIFPKVGMVSGYPIARAKHSPLPIDYLKDIEAKADYFLPQEWADDHAESIGMPKWANDEKNKGKTQVRLSYKGVDAFAQSHHMQFLAYREAILSLMQWKDEIMPNGREIEDLVAIKGMVRLCTTDRVVKHIGNVLDEKIKEEIDAYYVR